MKSSFPLPLLFWKYNDNIRWFYNSISPFFVIKSQYVQKKKSRQRGGLAIVFPLWKNRSGIFERQGQNLRCCHWWNRSCWPRDRHRFVFLCRPSHYRPANFNKGAGYHLAENERQFWRCKCCGYCRSWYFRITVFWHDISQGRIHSGFCKKSAWQRIWLAAYRPYAGRRRN